MAKSKTAAAAAASCKGTKQKNRLIPKSFSELEINAIELLVQLSGSSLNSGFDTSNNNGTEESDGKSRAVAPAHDHDHDQVSSWLSKYKVVLFTEEEEEVCLGRRKRRFRSILELYEMTEPVVNLMVANNTKRKRMSVQT